VKYNKKLISRQDSRTLPGNSNYGLNHALDNETYEP